MITDKQKQKAEQAVRNAFVERLSNDPRWDERITGDALQEFQGSYSDKTWDQIQMTVRDAYDKVMREIAGKKAKRKVR